MPNFLAHRLFRELRSLRLPVEDYVIAGSGPLFARAWIDDPTDLDIVARGAAWRIAAELGPIAPARYTSSQCVQLFDGDLDIFDDWFPGMGTVDELIKDADVIAGLRFLALDVVAATKKMMGRPRDVAHLAAMRAHGYAAP
ncbi:hypothetical protein [Paractinoplanes rishiriensis]|uniref:Uncharacterized protein n=1 Tax=Paractinoplanes rishiriensis TaxID=1050105 RepID=A0A919JTY6_9ACTN|nr:hypothetical protein [Actinoplanes rishiriensis]GIE93244.1 hypothetical protein Ari01nite_07090 [Actinoplanes rishiriensis]